MMIFEDMLTPTALLAGFAHGWFVWFHATCARRFRWDIDFRHVSKFGRSLVDTLNLCLMYLFAALAMMFFAMSVGVFRGPVAAVHCVVVAGLWLLRAGLQRWRIPASGAGDQRWLLLFLGMAGLALVVGLAVR